MSSGAREKSSGTAAMPEGGGMVPERPDTEVTAKPARRRFTAAYKLSVVERAEGCTEPGEVGRLLRREGLYSSQLSAWRKAAREGSLQELGKKRGPRKRPPVTKRWKERARELEREEPAAAGGSPQGPPRCRGPGEDGGAAGGGSRRRGGGVIEGAGSRREHGHARHEPEAREGSEATGAGLRPGARAKIPRPCGLPPGRGTEHAGAGAPIRWRTMEGGWPEVNGVAGVAAAARTTATRRRFTAEHKVRIVAEAGKCTERGAIGRLLEREGLFASRLSAWRKQAREGALRALGGKRGRSPGPPKRSVGGRRVRRLQRENAGLRRRLLAADAVAERQAKRCGSAGGQGPGLGGGREDRQRPRRGGGHRTGVRSPRRLPLDVLPPPGASERIAASAPCPAAGAVGGGTEGGL